MTTNYKHITQVASSDITLKKDGTIILNLAGEKKQAIGNYTISYPKAEARARGLRPSEYVERTYEGGIPYKGKAFGYTREEFKQNIIRIIERNGIDIKI